MFDFVPTRCPECPKDKAGKFLAHVVPPDMGDRANGDIVMIGEAPGANEKDAPFQGKAGAELNKHYLWLAGLERDLVYLTNTVKCRPLNNKTPSDKLRECCSTYHLEEEINNLKPRTVVLMGASACALVEGVNLDLHHGLPLQRSLFGHECMVVPMWHPAAGIHDTKIMRPLREDFKRLKLILQGRYEPLVDQYPNPDYRRLRNRSDLKEVICKADWGSLIAIDTETKPGRIPYCLTFSCEPGTGYMIRVDDEDLVNEFRRYMGLWKGQFVFHNYAYDGDVLHDMGVMPRPMAAAEFLNELGISLPMERVIDTMLKAFGLARFERVGLKVLAYRLLGVEMQEFEDLVLPYSCEIAYEYLNKLQSVDWPKPEKTYTIQPDGSKKDKQPQGLNTRIKRLFTDLNKCDGSLEKAKTILLDRWENWPNDVVLPAIEKFGNWPEPNISQVPEDQVIRYACRDADVTLRLIPVLDKIKEEITGRFEAA